MNETKKCPDCGQILEMARSGYNKYGCLGCGYIEKSLCAICNTPVIHDEENTCDDCKRTFCNEHNTVGSQWNGDRREDEFLSTMCEECAIDHQSIGGR